MRCEQRGDRPKKTQTLHTPQNQNPLTLQRTTSGTVMLISNVRKSEAIGTEYEVIDVSNLNFTLFNFMERERVTVIKRDQRPTWLDKTFIIVAVVMEDTDPRVRGKLVGPGRGRADWLGEVLYFIEKFAKARRVRRGGQVKHGVTLMC